MPEKVEQSGEAFLVARPFGLQSEESKPETESPRHDHIVPLHRTVDIPHVINRLLCVSRTPNTQDCYPAPPPMYAFFVFAARRFLGCRFQPVFFEQRADSWHTEQIEWGGVFVEAEHPFMEYAPSILSYRPLS